MSALKIAVVGIPGKWSTEVLAEAIAERTGFSLVVDMAEVGLDLVSNRLYYGDHCLNELDGIIVKKISAEYSPAALDRLELLRMAESAGVRVFSRPLSILRLIDRLACTVTLRAGGIPMPATLVTEDIDQAVACVQRFGEAVLKPLYSTKARGMELLQAGESEATLRLRLEEYASRHPMLYLQQKKELRGRDFGLAFLGGEFIGAYARIAQNASWNTTINSGGRYGPVTLSAATIELARKAQSLFELDFTTVDVAQTDDGDIIFEVSAFGGFRGLQEGCGIDAASRYADYVITRLEERA